MIRFEYLEPHSLRQAISLLEKHGESARIVAGATDLLVRWRQGFWRPQFVLNIKRIRGLDRVRYSPRAGLRLGTLVSLRTLETHPVIRSKYAALSSAAATFAGVQIRNLATIGGNVCNASPSGDTLPALLAFDAEARVVGPQGERWVPLDQFFVSPGRSILKPSEILVEFRLPPTSSSTGSLYIKHSPRSAMDIAAVGVASRVSLEQGNGAFRDVRIALGAVAPTPIHARTAEEWLKGRPAEDAAIHEAARLAAADARPIDDIRATAKHRQVIVEVLTRRTLSHALQVAQGTKAPIFEEQRRLAVESAF